MRFLVAQIGLMLLLAAPASAMDGVNTDTGDSLTVEDGTTFTEGDNLTVYDSDGVAHEMQVTSVSETADAFTVEMVESESGDAKTVEFAK